MQQWGHSPSWCRVFTICANRLASVSMVWVTANGIGSTTLARECSVCSCCLCPVVFTTCTRAPDIFPGPCCADGRFPWAVWWQVHVLRQPVHLLVRHQRALVRRVSALFHAVLGHGLARTRPMGAPQHGGANCRRRDVSGDAIRRRAAPSIGVRVESKARARHLQPQRRPGLAGDRARFFCAGARRRQRLSSRQARRLASLCVDSLFLALAIGEATLAAGFQTRWQPAGWGRITSRRGRLRGKIGLKASLGAKSVAERKTGTRCVFWRAGASRRRSIPTVGQGLGIPEKCRKNWTKANAARGSMWPAVVQHSGAVPGCWLHGTAARTRKEPDACSSTPHAMSTCRFCLNQFLHNYASCDLVKTRGRQCYLPRLRDLEKDKAPVHQDSLRVHRTRQHATKQQSLHLSCFALDSTADFLSFSCWLSDSISLINR